jgi:hypothetical protein
MAANSALTLTSLDFDTLKANLKNYMKSQSVFKDYDYEGSNMNVLLDVMSYNTYLNSFYLNMAISESFLDSAQMYSSVVSHAKELNYTPRSARSAKAVISCVFQATGIENSFSIPKGTQFSGSNANGGFTFVTDTTHVLNSATNVFTINGLEIYEGTYVNETIIVDNTIEHQRFILSNKNIDTTSIVVTVAEDDGANVHDYMYSENLYRLTPASPVYFIQATLDGSFEIVFGDDVFGRRPRNNAVVLVTYRVTLGDQGNGVKQFFINKDLGGYNGGTSTATVSMVSPSSEGAPIETIESIRFRAPRHYQTQDRAVTITDYKNLIMNEFTEVKDVNVYGGEEVTGEVQYGKVFIVPVTYAGAALTDQRKIDLDAFIKRKKIIGIATEVKDPDFIYVVPTIDVTVDFNKTSMTPAEIRSAVQNSIRTFNTDYLEAFDTTFRFSKFVEAVDAADTSILGNQITTQIYKVLNPTLGMTVSLSTTFNNELMPGTIASSEFLLSDGNTYMITDYNPNNDTFSRVATSTGFGVYNSNPVLYLKQVTTNNTQNYLNGGTINYATGTLSLKNLTVIDFLGSTGIEVYTTILPDDVVGKYNDVVEIDIGQTVINVMSV